MSLKKYTEHTHETVKSVTKTETKPETKIMKEEVLLAPKHSNLNADIEIVEEKILKFNNGVLKDILETLKTKYSDTDYFFRRKDNELHIVKYNEALKLNINEFVNSLLKFYSMKQDSKKITEGIKVKGNTKFSIVENMKSEYANKFIDDLYNETENDYSIKTEL